MEAKRPKLMDQSEIENLIIYDPEEASQILLGEPSTINNLNEVVNCPEEEMIEVEDCEFGVCEPELQDKDVDVGDGTLTDDEKLRDLLKSWGATNFYEPLHSQGIDNDNLHSLEEIDFPMLIWDGSLTIKDLIVFRNAHREWKKNLTQNLIDLKKILENRGAEITSYYKANSKLTDPLRERLVAIIIEGRVLSRPMMDNLADQICVIFPGETKSIYYEKEFKKPPRGLLYVRYSQSRTTKAIAKSVRSESERTASEDPAVLLTVDVQISVDFVNDKSNFRDLSRTEELFEHWRKCYTYRYAKKYTAAEVLNEWPLLQEKDAIPMVDYKLKLSKEQLCAEVKNYDGLVVRSDTKITAEVLEAGAGHVKVVGRAGAGVDNIDINAATKNNVIVLNTPGGNSISACELTCLLIGSLARPIVPAGQSMKNGKWDRKLYSGSELYGKTLAILGLGRIGREVGIRMNAFGMKCIGFDPITTAAEAKAANIEKMELNDIWPKADFTIHTPLIPATRNLISTETLGKCKRGVKVVNVARGGIINEADLLAALQSGQCGGAAVDVYEQEPPTAEITKALIQHPAVVATPHLGASTGEAQIRVAVEVAEQFIALTGRSKEFTKADGVINRDVLAKY